MAASSLSGQSCNAIAEVECGSTVPVSQCQHRIGCGTLTLACRVTSTWSGWICIGEGLRGELSACQQRFAYMPGQKDSEPCQSCGNAARKLVNQYVVWINKPQGIGLRVLRAKKGGKPQDDGHR